MPKGRTPLLRGFSKAKVPQKDERSSSAPKPVKQSQPKGKRHPDAANLGVSSHRLGHR